MDNFIKIPSTDAFINLIEQCKNHIKNSPTDMNSDLTQQLVKLQEQANDTTKIDKTVLDSLFSPNGPMQDLAARNSWEKEFEELSQRWDEILNFD